LLHDAAEAYIGDLPRPIKQGSELGKLFVAVEARLLYVIAEALKIRVLPDFKLPGSVHAADNWILAAEARDLMGNPDWALSVRATVSPPLARVPAIEPWEPLRAEHEFLLRYYMLRWQGIVSAWSGIARR
jgi:hypothetical protein